MTYAEFIAYLAKPGVDIQDQLTPDKADLWHAATGISGEAGELLDAVKKHVVYNKELDIENVLEELGDLEFYMEQLRQRLSVIAGWEVTRDECIARNMDKLGKRYANGYSDKAAHERADKGTAVNSDEVTAKLNTKEFDD